MNKRLHLLLPMLALTLGMAAAVPNGYYSNAKGKSDKALMTALHEIINGHTKRTYANLWTDFKTTDCNGTKIIDRYSTTSYTYSSGQCGTYSGVGDCYNREHSIPNSWWGGDQDTMYTDLFHMYPVDGFVNGKRSNYPFGDCSGGTAYGTGKLGACTFSGYTGTVFEVADEYKGDFARSVFYMATRYMNKCGSWTSGYGNAVFTSSSYKCLTTWAINQMLEWHRNDPVSTLETTRNDAVYGIQKNRNPFIDNPDLVEYIWGNKQGTAWSGDGGGTTTTPTLTAPAGGTTVNVGTSTGSGVSKTITVKGSDLTKSLTITVSGTGFTVTPTTVTAANANSGTTVTVTYNGTAATATGTLTISSSEVSATVVLTAAYNSGGGSGGDPTGNETIETWEGISGYGSYSTTYIRGAAFAWNVNDAGIWSSDTHKNGTQSLRLGKTAASSIAMDEDVTNGASKISFYAANWSSSEATPTLQVLYSTNAGSTWNAIGTCSPTTTWQQYSFDLNVSGNVRFKILQTAGARLNIDDIAITSNAGTVVTTPELTAPANGETVNVGTIAATGTQVSKTITVKGKDLTKALTVRVSGTGFSVSPATITAATANSGTTVTVTYSGTSAAATGTLTLSSSEVSTTVNLTAAKTPMPQLAISAVTAMTAEFEGTSSVAMATVTATDNSEDITLTVEGNFELSLNNRTWAKMLTLDPTGETFYVRLASTATAGTFNGSITATTSLVSAYADVQGTVNEKAVLIGDVNKDGNVSIADVTALIDYLLGGPASAIDTAASDVNSDGNISIADVTALIDYLLGGATTLAAPAWDAYPMDEGIFIVSRTQEDLEVYDLDGNCAAVAMGKGNHEIDLPAGVYIVSGETASRKVVVK